MRGGPPVDAPLSPGAIVQVQLDQLEDDLKLVPAQIGAWRAYTDKVQKLADDTTRIRFEARTAAPGPSSAIQQLDEIAAHHFKTADQLAPRQEVESLHEALGTRFIAVRSTRCGTTACDISMVRHRCRLTRAGVGRRSNLPR